MFSSSKKSSTPQRKSSYGEASRKEHGDDRRERRSNSGRSNISSTELRVTFENLLHSTSKCDDDVLDKNSVMSCVVDIYNWMVFDRDMQITLPMAPGSTESKMWPHGAKVDTRKRSESNIDVGSSKMLKQVDPSHVVCIASSVVSSNMDDQKSVKSRGEVLVSTPRGMVQTQQQTRVPQPNNVIFEEPVEHVRMVPEGLRPGFTPVADYIDKNYQYGESIHRRPPPRDLYANSQQQYAPPQQQYAGPPPAPAPEYVHVADQNHRSLAERMGGSNRTIPRYSILGGAPPPVVAEETPEARPAEVYTEKKKVKARVGTARRKVNNDGNGVPVTFAD